MTTTVDRHVFDLFVIGGGVNGTGIARDAQGRGLSVALAEKGDLAEATSSKSTKLFHGGLRYLEFFEFGLVRKALIERETLLKAMPHISWPMRFVLPYSPDMRFEGETPTSKLLNRAMPWMKGRRPDWLIRMGLFLYDNLGGRQYLPGTRTLDLRTAPEGRPLQDRFAKAYEYSDCWVEDSRLVVLNARDAEARGATIMTRSKVVEASREGDVWRIQVEDVETGAQSDHMARALVNAGGPWVENVVRNTVRMNSSEGVRLVRGSHIVVRRLFDHDKAYFFQGEDGRIIFAIPYETDFTLIGTTDKDHGQDPSVPAEASAEEKRYLCRFASSYFKKEVTPEDIVWTYSGVRPLYDDGAKSATAATRDYVLSLDAGPATDGPLGSEPPILSIFGGKITTYRKLAEQAIAKLAPFFPGLPGDWTAGVALPGGDFEVNGADALAARLREAHPFLDGYWARRLVRAYGTEARQICAGAGTAAEMGRDFGGTLTEAEVRWQMEHEYARRAEDVVWRRTKLGLRMTPEQIDALDRWMQQERRSRQAAE
ncbi:glycerol-3-phosphate dehydrogenase [Palleronia sediminis]|uniref:Glycerol-3-phosphate dehydrogenase n=1 Tax=Palleronia sediminis TaxID=2547833 RepID=A0A4R6AAF2_9RHOB|nr:glycerol-3-phosphate dehydrogenase [Palleronia sediminis]TDL79714.1 glycerol-3-phosphate dehydrogenase [Palleronia sediminis]